jgi:hypothetical protein
VVLHHLFSHFSAFSMASQLKYENVHMDDHDDSSITEVDESLIGDEKHMNDELRLRYTKKKRTTCLSILKEARWFVDTILLLVIVGLLWRGQQQQSIPKTSEHEVGGDITGVGPHCECLGDIIESNKI